jgi:hypothetical protein
MLMIIIGRVALWDAETANAAREKLQIWQAV